MTDNDEHPKEKTDIFIIGLYVLEIGTIAAIIYAMVILPMYLKPVT